MTPIVTIDTPATSRQLVELSYARLMLGLDTTEAADAVLQALIDSASAAAERWCNRRMIREGVTETWRLPQSQESLWLTRWPVDTITSITEDGVALTSAYWEVDEDTGRLYRLDGSDGRARWSAKKTVIVYTGGYRPDDDTGADLPDDLRDGVLAIVKSGWFARDRDPYLRSEEMPGVARYTYGFGSAASSDSGLPPEAESLLAPYRRFAIG